MSGQIQDIMSHGQDGLEMEHKKVHYQKKKEKGKGCVSQVVEEDGIVEAATRYCFSNLWHKWSGLIC